MLISEDGTVKLSVFDISTDLDNQNSKRQCTGCSSWDTAPEVAYESSCVMDDVWSLGISTIEMAEGRSPYAGYSLLGIKYQVMYQPPPSLTSPGWSSYLVDFVGKCVEQCVNKRASVDRLLKVSPFEFM